MKRWLALLWMLSLQAVLATGCVEADLGSVPLLCNAGNPRCPKGYTCVPYKNREYCVKEGLDPNRVLGGAEDGGKASSGGE